ncbi:unnamed protein product [Aphanomyces euteiches]|uniref:Aminotransferase class V domain-containing protein n=2 Tax=Aphanomyces euteiches TaxID=100861 RepID=A0A6G0XUV9_9STRA|nr:hypothetical protein Ae201684_000756 [Aphanomyces euteiches]KAH9099802.1 hypothetical protein Ae201684P_018812 [Aphanomyces euteiches]KAH9156322.1 hypothetical protein AeRB84_001753 [Aphanomyces euteiches]
MPETSSPSIQVEEFERIWSLEHFSTASSSQDKKVPLDSPIYRLVPALTALELTFVQLDKTWTRNVAIEWTRSFKSQIQLLRELIDLELSPKTDLNDFNLTKSISQASIAVAADKMNSARRKEIHSFVQSHFNGLPFGLGLASSHESHLSYDDIVRPRQLFELAADKTIANSWLAEAWTCSIERQLDAVETSKASISSASDLEHVARRYQWCSHALNLLGDLVALPTGPAASFAQSSRLKNVTKRISQLFPWTHNQVSINAAFDPTQLSHVLAILSVVKPIEETISKQIELTTLVHAQASPALEATDVLMAAQSLDRALRKFYFGFHQVAAETKASGEDLALLEEGWSSRQRYFCVEMALQQTPLPSAATISPFRAAFTKSLALQDPHELHFSTYGMGLAPDISLASVQRTHAFLAGNLNEIWHPFFEHDVPQAEKLVLDMLGLPHSSASTPEGLHFHANFGANVHEFLLRLFSCHRFDPSSPLQIVSSDAEFVSLTRQLKSWADSVQVHAVPLRPFDSFGVRLRAKIAEVNPALIHISTVYSNTQFRLPDAEVAKTVAELPATTMCILDVAQGIGNVPLKLPASPSLLVVGSGIKHVTAGPGLGFVAFPRLANDSKLVWTPANTGWIAYLGSMTAPPSSIVEFTPELAFSGGTPGYHYALRQLIDVQAFYTSQKWTIDVRHGYVLGLQRHFLQRLSSILESAPRVGQTDADISNAIVLQHSQVAKLHKALSTPTNDRPTVFHCDVRVVTSLRLGFGLHHVQAEVDALADALLDAWKSLATDEKIKLAA